jgi:FAD:protein FMN transferase
VFKRGGDPSLDLVATTMNRRHFLDLRHAARSAGQVVCAIDDLRATLADVLVDTPEPRDLALLHIARQAMATTFEIILPCGTPDAIPAAEDALDTIELLEAQLTVYRDDSEVSQLNRRAPHQSVALEERLYDLLKFSVWLSEQTQGAFDVTAGALVKTWGFLRRAGRLPSRAERLEALTRVGHQKLVFDDGQRSVRYLTAGLEINLGSVGKGFALDRAVEKLRQQWNVSAGLVHGGHSSIFALGTDPRDPRGWSVAISHPWDMGRSLAEVRLRDAALATSAATFQHLEYNGRKLGHVLDPRTGWPAEKMASASVIAPTAAEADALSTAFFVMGLEGSRAYCAAHPHVGAVLLPAGDQQYPVMLNLPPQTHERPLQ